MPDVFLSYAHVDAPAAERISEGLKAQGLTVFSDFAIVAGDEFSPEIERALSDSTAVVVLLSKHSSRSRWVEAEMRKALESRRTIIPVLLDAYGTENWVWPLISDRRAIRVDAQGDLNEVVAQVTAAVNPQASVAGAPMVGAALAESVEALLLKSTTDWPESEARAAFVRGFVDGYLGLRYDEPLAHSFVVTLPGESTQPYRAGFLNGSAARSKPS